MPDELYVGTRVDTSGLDSGMAQARARVRVSLDDLKAQYKSASAEVKTALANMAQAEQQFGALAQQGNQQAIAALKQYETQLAQARQAQMSASAGVDLLNQRLRELNTTTEHTVSEMTAASASVRTLETSTNGSVRAAERFLTTTLGLGPVLQAAFPAFGAISLLEVVVSLGEKFINLAHSVDVAYQAQLAYDKLSKELDKDFKNEVARAAELTAHYNRLAHGPLFEFREQLDNARLSAAAEGRTIEELQGKLKGLQDRVAAGTIINTRAGVVAHTTDDAKAAAIEMEGVQKQIENARLRQVNEEKAAQIALAEIRKQETEDAKKSVEERIRALREQDAEQLSELRANAAIQGVTGLALVNQERDFWNQRLAAERQYTDRVRAIHVELNRLAVASANEFVRGQKLAQEALRQGVADADAYQKALAHAADTERTLFEKQLTDQRKQLEETQRVGLERLRGASEEAVGELQIQEAYVKQRGDLHKITHLEELRELKELHRLEAEEELNSWRGVAEIYKAGGEAMAKEYEQALNRIAALQRRAHVQQIADDTAIAKEREKAVRDFVHTVDTQFFGHLNEWIQGQKTFAEAMAESWNDMVMDIIIEIERLIAKQIEEKIVMELLKLLGIDTSAQAAKNAAEAAAQMAVAQGNLARAETDAVYMSIEQYGPILGTGIGLGLASAIKGAGEAMIAVPAFETGGIVPDTQLVLAHGGEAILPRPLTTLLMTAAGKGNTANTVHVHYAPVVNGTGAGNLKQVLNDHADHLGTIMRQQARTFNRGVA